MPVSESTLRWLHGLAAVAHTGQAAAVGALVAKDADKAIKWPITFPGWNKILDNQTIDFNIGWLLPAFPALSAVNHTASAAIPGYYHGVLQSKVNYLRWIEFSASAGLMVVLLALISGVTELRTLVTLIILNVALQMIGLLVEKRKAEGASRGELLALTGIGWGVFMGMWMELFISFYTVIELDTKVKPPAIVYSIIFVLFGLFCSFGAHQVAYVFDYQSFETYEAGFIALSLVSKSLLTWMVYGGLLAGKRRFDEN